MKAKVLFNSSRTNWVNDVSLFSKMTKYDPREVIEIPGAELVDLTSI